MQLNQKTVMKRIILLLALNVIAGLLEVSILRNTRPLAFQAHPPTYYYLRMFFSNPITVFGLASIFYLIGKLRRKPNTFAQDLVCSGYILLGISLLVILVEGFKLLSA